MENNLGPADNISAGTASADDILAIEKEIDECIQEYPFHKAPVDLKEAAAWVRRHSFQTNQDSLAVTILVEKGTVILVTEADNGKINELQSKIATQLESSILNKLQA